MSLLLDALKKAAEKKAKKSGQDTAETDGMPIDQTEAMTRAEEVDAGTAEKTQILGGGSDAAQNDDPHARNPYDDNAEARGSQDGRALPEADPVEDTIADDATLLVMDDSIPMDGEGKTLIETADYTAEEMARLRQASRPDLTKDDVTAFLGDGDVPESAADPEATAATRTVEMRPLSIEDVRRAESSRDAADAARADERAPKRQSMDDTTAQSRPAGVPARPEDNDDVPTVINPESNTDSIDLDRLTHEETLGGTTTTNRSFAPDNYDRTLIKLADSDVSRIFPGMKPEPGAVMTPDYAKKVFMSKSSRYQGRYLKWMGAVGLLLLLLVGLLGLYQLSEESDRIDSSLARLKRDPLPGIIQPPREEKIDLFATAPVDEGHKAMPGPKEEAVQLPASESVADVTTEQAVEVDPAGDRKNTNAPVPATAQAAQATKNRPRQVAAAAKRPETDSRLKISRSERIDNKDRLLGEAYGAYQRADLVEARRLYAAVLAQDPENRDALLGMGAIEVQDGDYNRAIELYQKLLLLNPLDSEAMASLIAVANIDPQRGESRIKQMLAQRPDSPYLHFTLGNMYSRQHRWSEAQAAYFQALQLQPDNPNTAYNLAVSLEHLGKPEAAVPFYRRALDNRGLTLATFDADQVEKRIEVLSQ